MWGDRRRGPALASPGRRQGHWRLPQRARRGSGALSSSCGLHRATGASPAPGSCRIRRPAPVPRPEPLAACQRAGRKGARGCECDSEGPS